MKTVYGAKAPWPFLKGLIRDNRPVWFLEETGIPYKRVALDPLKSENKTTEYTALNRFQKVPTLLDDNGMVLTQSAAILHHLASTTGKLYPKTAEAQAKHMEWLFYCMTDVEPHAVQIGVLLQMTDDANKVHAQWMVNRAETILKRALNYLNGELEGKKFLMGDEFSAADILLGCCLLPIRKHALISERPNIHRVMESYTARPAFQRTMEINGT